MSRTIEWMFNMVRGRRYSRATTRRSNWSCCVVQHDVALDSGLGSELYAEVGRPGRKRPSGLKLFEKRTTA